MGHLSEFKVVLIGGDRQAERSVSVLAETSIIAIYRATALAIECGAEDFVMFFGRRAYCDR